MNHCKRALLVVMAMLAMSMTTAQTITFTQGDKGNGSGYQPTMLVVDKADADGRYYSVEPDLNAFSKIKGVMLREVDLNYKEYQCVKIDNTKGCGIMHVQRDGMKMHLVLSSYEKKTVTFRHVCVDLGSFTVASDSVLFECGENKHEYFYHWESTSANGNYALVYALVNDKANTAIVQGMLFDRSMRLQWKRPLSVAAIAQVLATDDGRIATCGYTNGENKTDGALVTFSVSDATGTRQGNATSVYKLGEVALLNVFGDRVLATALETDRGTGWAGSFTAGSVITTGTVYIGCTAYLFDVADGRMVNSDCHPFSKADARVFYNASLVSEIASPDVNFLSLRAKTTTPSGGAALYGRTWKEKVVNTKNAMTNSTYYYKGMMIVNADSTGHIAWMKPLMHDNGNNGDFAENVETDMVSEGDDIYLITNESRNDGDSYDPDNAARRAVMMVHGAISAYRFGADGTVAKRKLTSDGINVIMTRLRRQAPGVYTFISGQRKGCVTEINISK